MQIFNYETVLVLGALVLTYSSGPNQLVNAQLEAVGAVLSVVPVTSILATAGLVGVKLAALSRLLQVLGYDQAYLANMGGHGTAAAPIGLQPHYTYMFPYVPGLNITMQEDHGPHAGANRGQLGQQSISVSSASSSSSLKSGPSSVGGPPRSYPAMGLPGDYENQKNPFRGSEMLSEIFRSSGLQNQFHLGQQQQQLSNKGNIRFSSANNQQRRITTTNNNNNIDNDRNHDSNLMINTHQPHTYPPPQPQPQPQPQSTHIVSPPTNMMIASLASQDPPPTSWESPIKPVEQPVRSPASTNQQPQVSTSSTNSNFPSQTHPSSQAQVTNTRNSQNFFPNSPAPTPALDSLLPLPLPPPPPPTPLPAPPAPAPAPEVASHDHNQNQYNRKAEVHAFIPQHELFHRRLIEEQQQQRHLQSNSNSNPIGGGHRLATNSEHAPLFGTLASPSLMTLHHPERHAINYQNNNNPLTTNTNTNVDRFASGPITPTSLDRFASGSISPVSSFWDYNDDVATSNYDGFLDSSFNANDEFGSTFQQRRFRRNAVVTPSLSLGAKDTGSALWAAPPGQTQLQQPQHVIPGLQAAIQAASSQPQSESILQSQSESKSADASGPVQAADQEPAAGGFGMPAMNIHPLRRRRRSGSSGGRRAAGLTIPGLPTLRRRHSKMDELNQ